MKKIIILSLAIMCRGLLSGQTEPGVKNSFIGLTGGYSLLSGNYTRTDYNDPKSGFASRQGYNYGLEGAWFFSKHVGIGGVLSRSSFNTSNLQSLSDGAQEAFDVDSSAVTATKRYTFTNFLIGPYFCLPIKKLLIDLRVVGGLCYATTPQFRTDLEDSQINYVFLQDAAHTTAFAFQAGIGVRYPLGKHLYVRLAADYYYARPDFTIKNENRVNNAGRLIKEYKQTAAVLNFNVGVAYRFER